MFFKRKIYDKLLSWKKGDFGRCALLLQGMRRVGKSTLALEFARHEYDSYILINFAECPPEVPDLFSDVSDLDFIFLQLQLIYRTELKERRSLIIFDEVQFCPRARQAIKALVRDGRFDYLETGSLISIRKNVEQILIPSEEHHLDMYPLDFEEFLWAQSDEVTAQLIRQCFGQRQSPGAAAHRKLMRLYRLYMLCGGMPQAVEAYLEQPTHLTRVDEIKRNIIDLYSADLKKLDPTGKLSLLFQAIPAQLNQKSSRFHISAVLKDARPSAMLEYIAMLQDSGIVLPALRVSDPQPDLAAFVDPTRFKLFCADTGLFVTLMFNGRPFVENELYQRVLNDRYAGNLGYLYENAAAQALRAAGHHLYFHSWVDSASHHSHEIDLLLGRRNKVTPLEVKSASARSHRSLDLFFSKYHDRIDERVLLGVKELSVEDRLLRLPIYMAFLL